ncbi:hypothetical protein Tco_0886712, partial [Tanacetum coccineum]
KLRSAYDENVSAYDQILKDYDGALNIEKGLNERLEDELKNSEDGAHQLRVDREKLVVECGNGEILGRWERFHRWYLYQEERGGIQAILAEMPNMDLAASATFMEKYEELFDKRHPYVDKVTSAYLHHPSRLQNIMRDETGPTPGQGPRPFPTVSIS